MISIIQGASPAAWKAAGRRLAYARRPPVAGLRMLKMLIGGIVKDGGNT